LKEIYLKLSNPDTFYINHHPHWAYTLHAIERWVGKSAVIILPEKSSDSLLNYFQSYTINQVLKHQPSRLNQDKHIIINLNYPLLPENLWNEIATGEFVLAEGFEEKIVFSRLTQQKEAKLIKLRDKISNLRMDSRVDRIMAEAIIKADEYPIHPYRYQSGYSIDLHSNNVKIPILFSAPYSFFDAKVLEKFKLYFDITFAYGAPEQEIRKLLVGKKIWITGTCPSYIIGQNLLEAATDLDIIATPSTGTNHIDVNFAENNGIKVLSIKNSKFLNRIHASSEHSFALLIAMVKKIPIASTEAKYGHWRERENEFRSIELYGRTIGLVGYGRIGANMARYCHAFGMKIYAYDPFKKIEDGYVEQVSALEELLIQSEIVSLHYHLNESTYQSFSETQFNLLQDGAYFLNTARGELVDELALIKALESGKLRAAAIDVISDEHIKNKWNHPIVKYSRLNENLLLTPHIAGLTIDSETKAAMEILNEIILNYLI